MVRTRRYRVSYPLRPDAPGDPGRGFSIVEIETRADGWVAIRHAGGWALPAGALAGLMLELGLVSISSEEMDGRDLRLSVALPEELRGISYGFTGRRGSTGAFWGHCWEVTEDGRRRRLVAYYHESMYGRLNEPVGGYAAVLFTQYAVLATDAASFVRAFRLGLARVRPDKPVDYIYRLGEQAEDAWLCGYEPEPATQPSSEAAVAEVPEWALDPATVPPPPAPESGS